MCDRSLSWFYSPKMYIWSQEPKAHLFVVPERYKEPERWGENCFYIIFKAAHRNKVETQRRHQYKLIGIDAQDSHEKLLMQPVPMQQKDRASNGYQEGWIGVLLVVEKALWWVYHMTQVFSRDKEHICSASVFLVEKKKKRKKTFLTEYVKSYQLQYNTEPGTVQECQIEISFLS